MCFPNSIVLSVESKIKELKVAASNEKLKLAKPFNCPNCKVKTANMADLKMHLKTSHSKLDKRKRSIRKTAQILNENLSLLDISDKELTLEEHSEEKEETPEINCDWDPCGYK